MRTIFIGLQNSFGGIMAVGSDNVDYEKVIRNLIAMTKVTVHEPEQYDAEWRDMYGLEGAVLRSEYPLSGLDDTRRRMVICHILIGVVTNGIGGKENLGYQTTIPTIGPCLISFVRNGQEFMVGRLARGTASSAITSGEVTKKRLIKMGALLFQSIIERNVGNPPHGFYRSKGFSTKNFCLGHEYSLMDASEVLDLLRAIGMCTARTPATVHAGIQPLEAMQKALRVLRARIGNSTDFPTPMMIDRLFAEFGEAVGSL
jgi:hypothetical protein